MHDIIALSNCDPKDAGLGQLRQTVIDVGRKQQYWGEPRPIRWLLLADKLDKERTVRQAEPRMKHSDVTLVAQELGMGKKELQTYLIFHHNLGDLVYFDEPGLNDTVILCPQWLGEIFRFILSFVFFT